MSVLDLAERYLAALKNPNDDTLAGLAPVLADDVVAAGMFGAGEGRDAVLESTAKPPYPLLGAATWDEPNVDGDTITVRGTLPPGLPVVAAVVTMRTTADGTRLQHLAQELEQGKPGAPSALAIDDDLAALIDGALDNKTPFLAAYVDADGVPHVSPRGTVQSWSPTEVAMWARDPNGGMLRAIPTNPNVSLFYRDGASRAQYEIVGRMRVTEDPDERQRVFDRSPLIERNFDPLLRGKAIIVEVDSVVGSGPSGRVNMKRGA
jgi:hypothetical protein